MGGSADNIADFWRHICPPGLGWLQGGTGNFFEISLPCMEDAVSVSKIGLQLVDYTLGTWLCFSHLAKKIGSQQLGPHFGNIYVGVWRSFGQAPGQLRPLMGKTTPLLAHSWLEGGETWWASGTSFQGDSKMSSPLRYFSTTLFISVADAIPQGPKIRNFSRRLTISSEPRSATHQGPSFCGELWRSKLKFSNAPLSGWFSPIGCTLNSFSLGPSAYLGRYCHVMFSVVSPLPWRSWCITGLSQAHSIFNPCALACVERALSLSSPLWNENFKRDWSAKRDWKFQARFIFFSIFAPLRHHLSVSAGFQKNT